MAAFQKETESTKGRGFGTVDGVPSFLNRLKTWIVKAPGSGGPGWYIIDDQSAISPNPYIVCSNQSSPSNSNRAKIVVFRVSSTANEVDIWWYMGWDSTTHTGVGRYAGYIVSTQENVEYGYDFRGGPECMMIASNIAGNWDYAVMDEWDGIPEFLEADFTASLSQAWLVETGDNNNQVGGYEGLTGYAQHLDANGKLYFSVVYNGSTQTQINIYKDSLRTQLIGHTAMSASIAAVGVTADFESGIGGTIRRTAVVGNDTDIEVDFRLHFNTGNGASFTVGKYYYIWDFFNGAARINYFKVLSKSGDIITPEGLHNWLHPAGACASPYGHRWYVFGSRVSASGTFNNNPQIPYLSGPLYSGTQVIGTNEGSSTSAAFTWLGLVVLTADPDDEGRYYVMRPVVYEQNNRSISGAPNRVYGRLKNIFVSSEVGMAQMQYGRIINAKNYLTYFKDSQYAHMILDTTALS